MPIDDVTFAAEMTILRDRFGRRDMTQETIARYYDYLADRMTTEDFTRAARLIFNKDTFWPAPVRFLEAIKGNPGADSEAAWNALLSAATMGDHKAVTRPQLAALRAAGVTFRDVETANDARLAGIGKRFRAEYSRAANDDLDAAPVPLLEAS